MSNNFNYLRPFRFWCQKVLPLVYDDSLSYYELLNKVVDYINNIINNLNELHEYDEELKRLLDQLKEYVDNYFNNLDYESIINDKLDEMAENGTLENLVNNIIGYNFYNGINDICNNLAVNIGFIGDSITYGYYDGGEDNEQAPTNYPSIVESKVRLFNDNVRCLNYGVSGSPSGNWRTQYNQAIANDCKVISWMFGHNDFRLGLSYQSVIDNMVDFIKQCQNDRVTPIICSISTYYAQDPNRKWKTKMLVKATKNVCEKYGVTYVPVNEKLTEFFNNGMVNTVQWTPDGVHYRDYTPIGDIFCAYALPFTCNKTDFISGWRGTGIINSAGIGYGNITLDNIGSVRITKIVPNETYKVCFYSDKPFKINTLSGDYAGSSRVTWRIKGIKKSTCIESPIVLNTLSSQIDYYKSVSAPGDIRKITVRNLFDNKIFNAGYYELDVEYLDRGQSPDAYQGLRIYLYGFLLEKFNTAFDYLYT